MKILQINKFYYLRGGSERHLFDLSEVLEKNRHIVIPFSVKDSQNNYSKYDSYFADKVDLNKLSVKNIFKIFYNRDAAKKLEKLIQREKPDIAHLHNISYQLSPSIILTLKKCNIPIVQTLHDYKLICPNYRLYSKNEACLRCKGSKYYNCLLGRCVKNSWSKSFLAMLEAYWSDSILKIQDKINLFIAPSEFMKNVCVEFGVPPKKIRVVYNFAFLAPLGPATNGAHANISLLSKERETDYILYFGRLSEEKGVDVLIDAMRKVKNNIKLKIVGEGPEFQNFKFKILNLKLNERVEMLGAKYGEELQNLIGGAKAIIIPSVWPENMPLSLLESLAAGKIVIASRIGGIPEIIKDGENGILFTAGDSNDLADKINKLEDININSISKNAVISVKRFFPQNYYYNLLNIYNKILNRK